MEQIRPPGLEFHRRQNDSEKRARPSDQAPVHALDSVEPVHELPHAPGQSLRESVSRLHLVGPGDATASSCIRRSSKNPTDAELVQATQDNPEAAAARGLWGDLDFLERVAELNPQAEAHAVRRLSRPRLGLPRRLQDTIAKAICSTCDDNKIAHDDPQKFAKAVHLKDVHLAHGMQCADCHFDIDVHGNGNALRRTAQRDHDRRASIVTARSTQRPTLDHLRQRRTRSICSTRATRRGVRVSSGRATSSSSTRSMSPDVRWEVPQTIDTIDPLSPHYNPKSRLRENAAARRQDLGRDA